MSENFVSERAAIASLCAEYKLDVEWRNTEAPTYQLARIVGPSFSLIAYPHKTSAGNRHIRLRFERGNRAEAEAAIVAFDRHAGLNCTFQSKHMSSVEDRVRKQVST